MISPYQFFCVSNVARRYGINSLAHFASFLIFSNESGLTVTEVVDKYNFEDYASASAALRKMMKGDLVRNDGLNLFQWVRTEKCREKGTAPRQCSFELTPKGLALKYEIEGLLQLSPKQKSIIEVQKY